MDEVDTSIVREYARFINALKWVDLPVEVHEKTLDLVADWMANAAAGIRSGIGDALMALFPDCISTMGNTGVILGTLKPSHSLSAAIINGGASHALEFDDAYRKGLYHPGAPVIAAAFSAAAENNADCTRFLASVVAGYEISMRLAEAVNPGHNSIWHTTGTMGTLGAAAAASCCLKLNTEQIAGALGLAGIQASGLWEILPDFPQAKGLHAGKAAHSGLVAACLARQGIFGPGSILEGPRGVFKAMAPDPVDSRGCLDGLGRDWRILETTIKAYPVCGHTMTPIEAALKLAGKLKPESIQAIEVRVHPVSIGIAGNPDPQDGLQARFSIAYCVAVALARGQVTPREFLPEPLSDPLVRSLMKKIRLVEDDSLGRVSGRRPARIQVTLADGETVTETATTRKGDPENPLTPAEVREKFMAQVSEVWGREPGENIYEGIRALPRYSDFRTWQNKILLPWRKKVEEIIGKQSQQPIS